MKRILIILLTTVVFSTSSSMLPLFAGASDPVEITVKEAPSKTFLDSHKRSIAAETNVQTLSSPVQSLNRNSDLLFGTKGFGNPFLPGEDGWEVGEHGNVGYPVGDVSFPILISMLIIYFVYRSVSSTKRKSNL